MLEEAGERSEDGDEARIRRIRRGGLRYNQIDGDWRDSHRLTFRIKSFSSMNRSKVPSEYMSAGVQERIM